MGAEGRVTYLSIVVPCYNEELCLDTLHRRVTDAAKAVTDDYELILVNDGSKDRTWPIIADLAAQDDRVVGVDLSRNHGHQLALTAGLSLARGDYILIIDADLQDPPEALRPMLDMMRDEQADVVYGQRLTRAGETFGKQITAKLFYRMLKRLSDVDLPLDTGDFRLMSRRALAALMAMPEQSRFIRGMVAWIGFKQVAYRYHRDARLAGETHYPLKKMIKLTIDATTGFSILPLRMASYLGLILAAVGMLLLGYTLFRWANGQVVPGWASLMVIVVLLGSGQMLIAGMLGEYLGRLYMQSKGRPLFLIREVKTQHEIGQVGVPGMGFIDRPSVHTPATDISLGRPPESV
ncbi:glycosyltransferase [Sphingomonas crocodyli]|uniref:Glycosyltransferase n=1 Tax=Sphingomonas crocodyli TaxID=1979270 RepID=A0A437M0R5_9SPHN|nr:glycosyltransferase [Sphingomonas crocodyli]